MAVGGDRTMSAYLITQVVWNTPEARQQYVQALPGLAEKYGGRWVVASSEPKVVEGKWIPGRLVVAEFPTMEALTKFYESEEYRPLLELRLKHAKCETVMVQGT
jgi:uncharacterized protein (DUF1330 family)